jgi:uncharacterized glyoxalase superfamily protein PhnB
MTDTDPITATSEVVVATDPATAFSVFTGEMDLWWQRGPINFWSDAHRVVEIRCEPGVGGRIMEVLDDGSGDAVLVRATVTAWEPPGRLAFQSALDDVATEITFAADGEGTRVIVTHTVPVGGKDTGGTAWSRVVPKWLGDWCERRDHQPHQMVDIARLALGVYYQRPAAASRFLAEIFGFGPVGALPEGDDPLPEGEYGPPWIEFRIGNSALNVFTLEDGEPAPATQQYIPWVYVDDLDAHFQRAKAGGAVIVEEPHPFPGSLVYVAEDLEGHHWRFSQKRPTML